MTSEAQRAANRRNAQNSTGPTTERGKATVAGNALRHGLRAEKVLTYDETNGDFQAFLEEQRQAHQPADPAEEQLVERMAICAWRLRRIYRIEADLIDSWRHSAFAEREKVEIGAVFEGNTYEISTVSRYETALDRALHRAYVMLERRQAKRRGEIVPAPIAVAVAALDAVATAGEDGEKIENFRTKPISPIESAAGTEK